VEIQIIQLRLGHSFIVDTALNALDRHMDTSHTSTDNNYLGHAQKTALQVAKLSIYWLTNVDCPY